MAKEDKRAIWERRIAACERSGMSRRAWCAAHGVSVNTLDYWRRQLRSKAAPTRRSRRQALVPIVVRGGGKRTPEASATAIEIVLPSGVSLRAPLMVEARWLADLLRELGPC